MRYFAGLIFLGYLTCAQAENTMSDPDLTLSVECPENPKCLFTGKDVPFVIKVRNNSNLAIDFAGYYVKRVGPRVRLIDRLTGKFLNLRTSLAPRTLLDQFEPIMPGDSFEFSEFIPASSIRFLRDRFVDLTVEVAITTNARQLGMESVQYRGQTKFSILGEDTHAIERPSEAPILQR